MAATTTEGTQPYKYSTKELDREQTKGTVLSVCFRCVDTLVLVLKYAEGMSLCCDAICALAYCGRHESSHVIKAHADSTRRLFVEICVDLWLII